MQIKAKIENWAKETLGRSEGFSLVHPKDLKNGDFTLIINGDGASADFDKLNQNKITEIGKIEFVAPRFVNIYLSESFFAESLNEVNLKGEEFGRSDFLAGQKIIIEYTNTNVLKPMHIGHLMGNVIGQALSNIFEFGKAEVKRNTYQGDVGLHIAKALWGIKKLGGVIEGELLDKVDYVGQAYALGANAYEDDPSALEEIKEINKKAFEKSDAALNEIYTWARQVSLDHFEDLYKALNTKFDYYFFESEVSKSAVEIVKEFLAKGVFEESEGAVIFRGEKYDPKLHTRVFLTQQGLPLYEAKDIAHALRKESLYSADRSIIITANEQNGYFKVVLKALEQINKNVAEKTKHLPHGMLRLPSGKMSSRTGDVITAEALISKVKEMVMEKITDREFSIAEKESLAELVAIGAIKYSILRQAIGGDIVFDFDKSISFEGDSGPYLQYTCVRAKSVLEKALPHRQTGSLISGPSPINMRGEKVETKKLEGVFDTGTPNEVERLVYRFPEIVEKAGQEYAPHYLVTYLVELSAAFNSFYANNKIIDSENPELTSYRLALTKAVSTVLTNGLHLLGIKVPERM